MGSAINLRRGEVRVRGVANSLHQFIALSQPSAKFKLRVSRRPVLESWKERPMKTHVKTMLAALAALAVSFFPALLQAASNGAGSFDSKAAASYLDQRADWWMTWSQSVRDHDTHCVSCHTALPYALARPALRAALGEQSPSPTERKLLDNVTKRVRIWSQLEPFYSDEQRGAPKTAESRGTEAVLNALILASYDAHQGKLGDDARLALDNMWALQLQTGDGKGAWNWLNFHNQPWEADD